MKRARCPDCRKLVRDKPILGTVHICLSPYEREARAAERRYMVAAQQRDIEERKARSLLADLSLLN